MVMLRARHVIDGACGPYQMVGGKRLQPVDWVISQARALAELLCWEGRNVFQV